MIEETNEAALIKLGFDIETAKEFGRGGISTKTIKNNNHIVIDGKENKVYSELEGARKYYFENGLKFPTHYDSLRNEYYDLKLEAYVKENEASGLPYIDLEKEFHNAEIIKIENEIATTKDKFKEFSKNPEFTKISTRYLNWLKQKDFESTGEGNKIKPRKSLSDFIGNIEDKQAFIDEWKATQSNEQGQAIRAGIDILKDEGLLIIPPRQFKEFYNLLNSEFGEKIGSYTSINDAKKNKGYDECFVGTYRIKLNTLITRYKTK